MRLHWHGHYIQLFYLVLLIRIYAGSDACVPHSWVCMFKSSMFVYRLEAVHAWRCGLLIYASCKMIVLVRVVHECTHAGMSHFFHILQRCRVRWIIMHMSVLYSVEIWIQFQIEEAALRVRAVIRFGKGTPLLHLKVRAYSPAKEM